jgi:hypothetical protein
MHSGLGQYGLFSLIKLLVTNDLKRMTMKKLSVVFAFALVSTTLVAISSTQVWAGLAAHRTGEQA